MAILIISRKKINFTELLENTEDELLLLTSEENVKKYQGNYSYIEGFNNFDFNSNVIYRALELGNKYDLKRVVVTSEYDILRTAIIRDKLKIPGQGLKSALAFRDKVCMKDYVKGNVSIPKYLRVNSVIDIFDFINENKLPVVIKPIDGAGSRDTFIVRDMVDLSDFLELNLDSQFEIEEYIPGEMYTIDGLYKDGKVVFSWPGRYINGGLCYKEGKRPSNIQLSIEHPLYDRLQQFIINLLGSMPMPDITSFHAEVFHSVDDQIILCEVGSRTGGAGHNELSIASFNINLTNEWIKGQCGLPFNYRVKRDEGLFGYAEIPPRIGTLISVPERTPFDWVINYQIKSKLGTNFKTLNGFERIALVVVSGDTENDVINRLNSVTSWVSNNCKWG